MSGKLIIFSAPSGAGKSTLVQHLLSRFPNFEFSISATSRPARGNERDGFDYYFLSPDEFRQRIENNEFVEYEEVYPDCFYGTLRSEIDRISAKGKDILFDVDVVGGLNIKKQFGNKALSVFIVPPDLEILHQRLINRATDSEEMIAKRVGKAKYEMTFAPEFDAVIVNDILAKSKKETETIISKFLSE
ncbi:MAG: guanylate kinase [Paludibacter sp.]|nr:guanylate kinase [Paludibacter sp.]